MEHLIEKILETDPKFAEWLALQEESFAYAAAQGFLQLSSEAEQYKSLVMKAAENGPTLARIMAVHLVPVLQNDFCEQFLSVLDVMMSKGTYTLDTPFHALSELLDLKDTDSAYQYLELLRAVFSQEFSYNQSLKLIHLLPKAVLSYSPRNRIRHIQALKQVLTADVRLADPFSDGMEKGLALLSEDALNYFIRIGLEKYRRNRESGIRFFLLESSSAIEICAMLQTSAALSQVQQSLNRYLHAGTHIPLSVKAISYLPEILRKDEEFWVCSDGRYIYLPDEIALFPNQAENIRLYKCLSKLEAAYYEFHTFGFDFEEFFADFSSKPIAEDLFTIFEHGRIRILLEQHYPGIVRQAFPLLEKEPISGSLAFLYVQIALSKSGDSHIVSLFKEKMRSSTNVENCAELIIAVYPEIEALFKDYQPLKTPFNRKPRLDLFFATHSQHIKSAKRIRQILQQQGINTDLSDIQEKIIRHNGQITADDIRSLIANQDCDISKISEYFKEIEIIMDAAEENSPYPVFRYHEWSKDIGNYLHDYVRVSDRYIAEKNSDFYPRTLAKYHGLIRKIRHAFEFLKPEGLLILRRWTEGDIFDYPALLEFAVDKKAKRTPKDRLYIKRVKQQRDVAVLLLVDLSRSTANSVINSSVSVLDVEKEAIVLFCEALNVVGDAFAIAGFSGTGRLGVDYFRIKDFDEDINDTVKARISAMSPQRSTRMGAAIRHAAAQLMTVSAKLRLLMLLSDGFPNDTEYKREYAIEDTRKAISEAQAKSVHVRAITVNLATDAQLDDLYGSLHHNVISDVRELPDKLLRIYRSLTH